MPLAGDDLLRRCWLAYLSDDLPCDAVVRAHPRRAAIDGAEDRFIASLDHSVWFHATPHVEQWHLYDVTCLAYGGGRGLALGHAFDADGTHVATFAQEALVREPAESARSLLGDQLGDGVEVVEVGEVEHLQVQALGAGLGPARQRRPDLVGRAGDAVAAQLVGLAADRRGPPLVLGRRRRRGTRRPPPCT